MISRFPGHLELGIENVALGFTGGKFGSAGHVASIGNFGFEWQL